MQQNAPFCVLLREKKFRPPPPPSLTNFSLSRVGMYGMVVGFTTTLAISAYHHWCCEFKSLSGRGVQHYVMKFVSDLRQVGGFLRVLQFPPRITDGHNITEIFLKVAFNTIIPIPKPNHLTLTSIFNFCNSGISQIYYTYSLKYQIITSTEASVKYTTSTVWNIK